MAGPHSDSGAKDGESDRSGRVIMRDVPEELDRLHESVLTSVEACGFDEASTFAVRLALEEAVANGFRHGNSEDPNKTVTVHYRISPHEIWIAVEDEGPGFCLLYTSPSPRDRTRSRMPSSA